MGSQVGHVALERYLKGSDTQAMTSARHCASDGERSQERVLPTAVSETGPRILSSGDGLGTPQVDAPDGPRASVFTILKPKARVTGPERAKARVTPGANARRGGRSMTS